MSSVNINGKSFSGRNITIINGKVIVDGQDCTPVEKTITIQVTGDVELLSVDAAELVTIDGNAGSVKTMSGDVIVKRAVEGSVSTMSGAVSANEIRGNISSMSGSIRTR